MTVLAPRSLGKGDDNGLKPFIGILRVPNPVP
jgi:hypothetical protein